MQENSSSQNDSQQGSESSMSRNRFVMSAAAVLLIAAVVVALVAFAASSRHDGKVNEVVSGVTELNSSVSYNEVLEATNWPETNPASGGSELYALLAVDPQTESGQSAWLPGEVSVIGASIVSRYDVESALKDSCVISVLRPDGDLVQALDGSCTTDGAMTPDIWTYINS